MWTTLIKSPLSPDSLKGYSELLTSFCISYDQPTAKNLIPKVTNIHSKQETTNNLIEYGKAIVEQTNIRLDKHGDKYSWFESSLLLADFLAQEYPEELDPGRIIAEYLTLLFPDKKLDIGQEIIGDIETTNSIRYGSSLYNIVVQLGYECIESAELLPKAKTCLHIALTSFLNPRDELHLPEGVTLNDVIEATIVAPKGFFYSWARSWWLKNGSTSPQITTENLKKLLSLCTIIGVQSIKGITEARYNHKFLSMNLLWDLIYKINNQNSIIFDSELREILAELFADYTDIKRRKFCGVSPLCYISVNEFFIFLDSFRCGLVSMADLTFLLARGNFDFAELYLLPESEKPDDILDEFSEKQDMYILLFRKSIEEGLPELGNALLSLYLLGVIFHEHSPT